MPDTAEAIQTKLKDVLSDIQADRVHTYAVLLGRKVIDTMTETLGEANALVFLENLEKFGRLMDASPDVDLFTLIPVHQLLAFQDFTQYKAMLVTLQQKLKLIGKPEVEELLKAINAVCESANATKPVEEAPAEPAAPAEGEPAAEAPADAPEPTQATAASKKPKVVFGDRRFRGLSLPSVPLSYLDRSKLPASFPDYTNIRGVVVARFNKSDIRTNLYRDLNACLAKSLKAVALHRKFTESVTTDPRDYIAEAQQYLMDHNWIGYGLDARNLVSASDRLDAARVPHLVDYTSGILVVANDRTVAYSFLGVNLEAVLRNAIMVLTNDVRANYTFEGKQSALAVIVAACSSAIQEAALLWLENVQDAFNKNAAAA